MNIHPNQERDDKIWQMYTVGCSYDQIANTVGLKPESIRRMIRRYPGYNEEVKRKRGRKKKNYALARIEELIKQGELKYKIADQLGYSLSKLKYIFKRNPHLQALFQEGRNPKKYDHDKDKETILKMRKAGSSYQEISQALGGRSRPYIRERLRECPGGFVVSKKEMRENRLDKIRFLKLCGYSVDQIADEMGMYKSAVYRYLRESRRVLK